MAKRFVTTKVEIEGREETKIVELPSRNPEPWGEDANLTVVGQRAPRADALEKVTGAARYTADVELPGMLYAAILRSPVANGRVVSLDLGPARAIAGVRGTIEHDDMPNTKLDGIRLFDREVHYAGQPLAAVCADSLEIARQAVDRIRLDILEAPHAVDTVTALARNAPLVRKSGNLTRHSPDVTARGDVDAGLRDADVTITREYRTPVALHTALEPHGAVADWSAGRVTVYESTQGIFNTRRDLADAFDLPLTNVRVIKNYMGGGFGAKNGASMAAYVACALSKQSGRPVRCVYDREGEQTDAGNRPSTTQHVTLGAKRDGTLTAIVLDATIGMGAGGYPEGPGRIYHEMYRCANVRTTENFVYTHTGPRASFRAPGHVEGSYAMECAMDSLARELKLDPLELRRHNYANDDQEKQRPYSAKHLDECYALGAERFGWDRARARGPSKDRLKRGVGMASLTWNAGGGPPAYASVRINRDGTIEVLTGAQDLGTGARTVFSQIAAEVLGARLEDVRTILGDTERLPFASNSWGSITTASVGPAVRVAALEARDSLFEAAAELLGCSVEDIEARDSELRDTTTNRCMMFKDVCGRLGDVMIIGQGSRGPNPDKTAMSAFGAHFAEVEVDIETGRVRVLRIVAAHDSGRIINPTLAEGQLEGGIIQGIGYALFEERVVDAALGVSLNPTMHDYKIPTIGDVPSIDAFFIDRADVVANHTGAKGVAEPPIIPVAPAIANAVADALGVEINELPLTPWRVLDRWTGGRVDG
ncbi:MAG TPA: xanthine dehydrogenase family protein molybdopterin-binding subunit [Gemmatimonadaceae bacterium]|jgi:xanthine dehydrogenase YagR molybdenum-binding subunit|nr:xanthine dehydrogenase family protein molybdopterin-binding subunit [Gemmatimonadaceae bacterium]